MASGDLNGIDLCGLSPVPVRADGAEDKYFVMVDNERYLLKFPNLRRNDQGDTFARNTFSEYIGSHIFESLGIPTQETSLVFATRVDGQKSLAVACKDFVGEGQSLLDMRSIMRMPRNPDTISSWNHRSGFEWMDVVAVFDADQVPVVDAKAAKQWVWDVLVADSLLANPDRHLGNMSMLVDDVTLTFSPAPVYDCGSSLGKRLSRDVWGACMANPSVMKGKLANSMPACHLDGKRQSYLQIAQTCEDPRFFDAVLRIAPAVDLNKIDRIIDETPYLGEHEKEFYSACIHCTNAEVLQPALKRARKFEIDHRPLPSACARIEMSASTDTQRSFGD